MSDNINGGLWTELFDAQPNPNGLTDGVIPFFEQQCKDIEKSSCGKVHARFKKLEIVERQTGVATLTNAVMLASMVGETVHEEKDQLTQEDANGFYEPHEYVFDVYSDQYKFRVLSMRLGMSYPVSFDLDDGIAENLGDDLERFSDPINGDKGLWIQSNEELNALIELIVSRSRKFRAILIKMAAGQ